LAIGWHDVDPSHAMIDKQMTKVGNSNKKGSDDGDGDDEDDNKRKLARKRRNAASSLPYQTMVGFFAEDSTLPATTSSISSKQASNHGRRKHT
jgi:hypothetical protein